MTRCGGGGRGWSRARPAGGSVRRAGWPRVCAAVRRERSGMFARAPEWWELRTLRMPEEEAATPKRFVVLELDGTTQAYGIYRSHPKFEDAVSKGRLEV